MIDVDSVVFSDIPQKVLPIVPFFHCELPLVAPGINASYQIARSSTTKKSILVHTPAAHNFLEMAAWHFRNLSHIKLMDQRIFAAISKTHEKVPVEVVIRLHCRTLWLKDVDGPDKIILDALFNHFKFIALEGQEKNWNDNRVVALHVYKDIATSEHPSIEIEVRCAIAGITGK